MSILFRLASKQCSANHEYLARQHHFFSSTQPELNRRHQTPGGQLANSKGQLLPRDLTRTYPRIVRGEGVNVYDESGKRYLDAIAGIAVVNVGHGRAQVAEALAAQAQTIAYVQSSIFDNQPAHELAERLGRFTPAGLNHAYFVSGGSEANETATQLARQYHVERGEPSRYLVVSRWQSYHGGTLGALSAS